MNFSLQTSFPAPAATVIRMFVDRDYVERKYRLLDVSDFAITDLQKQGDDFAVSFQFRAAGQSNIPEFARKLVGETIRVKQVERWNSKTLRGSIDIEIAGAPAKVQAAMQLVASAADSSVLKFDWTVHCGVPLLGGKVEKVIADDVQRRVAADGKASIALVPHYL